MFQYFPTNYVWSLSAMIAITHGGQIGEVDAMCAPLRDAALAGDDPGTQAFFEAWQGGADKLAALAAEDLQRGRALSAGEKLGRAALYYSIAERMLSQGVDARHALYERSLAVFRDAVTLARENCERIEIPYAGRHLAALHVRAVNVRGPAPLVVVMNGLDSTKEMLYRSCLADYLSRRGLSALFVDQPGTGEALRLQGFHAVPNTETWAAPIIDYLETRDDVDANRIAALGVSLGGYYAPRAVAFEPRFAAGAVWGANHDWREVQKRRLAKEGENPVPHYWQHVEWVFGASGIEDFMRRAEAMHLDGVLERIKVPFLVTHGEKDRQIPLQYAHRSYEQLVNSPGRELKIFTAREGGVEHSSLDNATNAGNYIADWLAERLGGTTA